MISGMCNNAAYTLGRDTYRRMRQAYLLIPLPHLLTRTRNKTEALEVYKNYYSHLPKQGTEEWKLARAGELRLPLVAGEHELRYIAHRDRKPGSTDLLDLYDFTLTQVDELVQTDQVRGSIAFGGSEITKIMKERSGTSAASIVREKMLDKFDGNIHTRWGNTFEDVINEFMDMILDCHTASFGSIPGIRNADGAAVQNYSPDGVAVVKINRLMEVLCQYVGTNHMTQHPSLAEFRGWIAAQIVRDSDPATCDATLLYEFKCPTVRIPDGTIPEQYALQPQLGATTIGITNFCLFTDTSFRKCTVEDFGFSNANYDRVFHNGRNESQLDQPHLACGFLGIYRIGRDAETSMAEILAQAVEQEAVDQDESPLESESRLESELQIPREELIRRVATCIAPQIQQDLIHAGESMRKADLRRRSVHLAGLAYKYLGIYTVPQSDKPQSNGPRSDVLEHMTKVQQLLELREKERRAKNYNPLHSFDASGPEESELTTEEIMLLRQDRTIQEYVRHHYTGTYRETIQDLVTEICMHFVDADVPAGATTPTGRAALEREQKNIREILSGHVRAVVELLDSQRPAPAYMNLTDYGKASAYELSKLLTTLEVYRHKKEGVKAYYPSGYYCVRDVRDPRMPLMHSRPENYINFSIANEQPRARDWLKRETDRFIEFCRNNEYVAIGLIPYKMMKLTMVPLVPKSIEELIRPILEERARVCNEYRGLDKAEILRRLNELPGTRRRGRKGSGQEEAEDSAENGPVSETSELDAFLGNL